ncbi:MAG: 2-oxoacid:ferredoxin oxidoreductase subunit beta [Nanoarchaeota archaeon]|nr:2-oxoacid:ferredoxin oxidoreductase subunit beta [Nanoarchaeota archaeon]
MTISLADLTTQETPTWCPGCGDHTILASLKNALAELVIDPKDVVIVSGIGCGSKIPHYVKTYGFEGLHGRGLPVAMGIKLANPTLTVIAISGDGDTYGIGGNHFMHTMRRNLDIVHIVQDNQVYGLTKGQYSPTSKKGFKSPSSPHGALETPVNPLALALTMGASYVARGYALNVSQLKELFVDALNHKGYAFVDVLQPCVNYNRANTPQWYQENTQVLQGNDPANWDEAMKLARRTDKLPLGLFFKEDRPTYDGEVSVYEKGVPATRDISNIDLSMMLKHYV